MDKNIMQKRSQIGAILLAFLFLLISTSIQAGTLTGKFSFKKRAPRGVLIYFSEDRSLKVAGVVDQLNTNFKQSIVISSKGSKVVFKNSDSINHNIYANDREAKVNFDIGLAPPQSTFQKKVTWNNGKLVRISCKIHPKMRAWVASISSKYSTTITFQRKQKRASFIISNIPDHLSKVIVWMPGYSPIEIAIKKGDTQKITLRKKRKKKKKRGTLTLTRS
ncbi:MAG: plastocyanin [bacterium]|jgi:plastocyanin